VGPKKREEKFWPRKGKPDNQIIFESEALVWVAMQRGAFPFLHPMDLISYFSDPPSHKFEGSLSVSSAGCARRHTVNITTLLTSAFNWNLGASQIAASILFYLAWLVRVWLQPGLVSRRVNASQSGTNSHALISYLIVQNNINDLPAHLKKYAQVERTHTLSKSPLTLVSVLPHWLP